MSKLIKFNLRKNTYLFPLSFLILFASCECECDKKKETTLFDNKLVTGQIWVSADDQHQTGVIKIDFQNDTPDVNGDVPHYEPTVFYNIKDVNQSAKVNGLPGIKIEVEFTVVDNGYVLMAKNINAKKQNTTNSFNKAEYQIAQKGMNWMYKHTMIPFGAHKFGHAKTINFAQTFTSNGKTYYRASDLMVGGNAVFSNFFIPTHLADTGGQTQEGENNNYYLDYNEDSTLSINGVTLNFVDQVSASHPPHD